MDMLALTQSPVIFAHCDAALTFSFSVEHVGKLFERLMGGKPVNSAKHYYWEKIQELPFVSEFLPTPRKPEASGKTAAQGGLLLLLFLPAKKSKETGSCRK